MNELFSPLLRLSRRTLLPHGGRLGGIHVNLSAELRLRADTGGNTYEEIIRTRITGRCHATGRDPAHREGGDTGAISLGTTMTGTVKEHTLEDGRAEITVRLVVSNALAYTVSGCNVLADPLVFGARPQEVLGGATPSLADGTLVVKFNVRAPGLPLVDIQKLLFGPVVGEGITLIRFDGDSYGQLRSAFGVPDGTPGRLVIRDTFRVNPSRNTIFQKHRIDLSVD
jgi:hypothetical protein